MLVLEDAGGGTELGWEEQVSDDGQGWPSSHWHIWAQNLESSKNPQLKPGFLGRLKSEFVNVRKSNLCNDLWPWFAIIKCLDTWYADLYGHSSPEPDEYLMN